MGILALVCALLLLILIPNEIWKFLLYLGLVATVAVVGYFSFVAFVLGL